MDKPEKIFIVNDDEISSYVCRAMVSKILGTDKITWFRNGQNALDLLEVDAKTSSSLPDMIFLDINMPEMSGWEFLDEYKNLKPLLTKVPRIFIHSSTILDRDIFAAKNHPEVDDFINSALSREVLEEIFRKYFPSPEYDL